MKNKTLKDRRDFQEIYERKIGNSSLKNSAFQPDEKEVTSLALDLSRMEKGERCVQQEGSGVGILAQWGRECNMSDQGSQAGNEGC